MGTVNVKDSLFKENDEYKRMAFIPVKGVEDSVFKIKSTIIDKNGYKVPVFEVKVAKNIVLFDQNKDLLKQEGIKFHDHGSHIIPVIIGDAKLCTKASQILLDEHDIYVQPINFPTVPIGTERLRLSPTPLHSDEMISKLAKALKDVFNELNIKLAA